MNSVDPSTSKLHNALYKRINDDDVLKIYFIYI